MAIKPTRNGIVIHQRDSRRERVSHPLDNGDIFRGGERNQAAQARVKANVELSFNLRDVAVDAFIHILNRGRQRYIVNVHPPGDSLPAWWPDVPLPSLRPLARPFFMGFTNWPYDATVEAVFDTYDKIQTDGDIVAHHFQGGVPWTEAEVNGAYHSAVDDEINTRLALTDRVSNIYLAVDSLNGARDGLSGYWAASENLPLPGSWAGFDFSNPRVIEAYSNFQ